MIRLECSRTTIKDPSAFNANLGCEQNLEVALLVNYLFSGFSFAVAFLCLYHLIKRFQYQLPHYIILAFSILLLAANIISLILITQSYHTYIHFILAAAARTPDGGTNFPGPSIPNLVMQIGDRAFAQDLYLPIFFWVTDAFLLHRAWVIWHGKRLALIAPYFLFFASLVSGIICQSLFAKTKFFETPWVPALSFSSAIDVLTTGMIGGRLYFHHRRRQTLAITDSKFFISALVICVESGLMSTVSKLVQFAIPISDRALNVVPLVTIASNLIILRKALNTDIAHSTTDEQMTGMRFEPHCPSMSAGAETTTDSMTSTNSRIHYGRTRRDTRTTFDSRPKSIVDIRGDEKKLELPEEGKCV